MGLITEDVRTGKTSDGPGLGRPTRREIVEDDAPPYSSEITLGMRSMLAIFFGLVLVCGVFFGLGYSVGRNGGLRPGTDETAASPALGDSSVKKPSATEQGLTPVPTPSSTNPDQNNAAQNNNPNTVTETDLGSNPPANQTSPAQTSAPTAQPVAATSQPAATKPAPSAQPVAQKPAPVPTPAPQTVAQRPAPGAAAKPATSFSNPYRPATPQAPTQSYAANSASPAPSGFMVQIAAVRQPQDANVLVGALQQHGFHAVIRHEAQDQLLHVQLGPFATRAEAFSMRSKLLANGYNAVVK